MKHTVKVIGQVATKTLSQAKFWASRHASDLLLGAGVAGFGATCAFVAKGAVKVHKETESYKGYMAFCDAALEEDLEPEQLEFVTRERKEAKRIVIRETVKSLAPAAGFGVFTLGCFTGGHIILKKRNVALVAAYKVIDEGFKTYRRNVVSELGEEADYRFKNSVKIFEEKVTEVGEDGKKHKVKKKVEVIDEEPSGYSFIYDDRHCVMPVTNSIVVRDNLMIAENSANVVLKSRGYITLNEVLRSIGLHETSAGQIVGWQTKGDGDGFVRFNIQQIRTSMDEDGLAFLIDFNVDGPIYQDIDKYTRLWDEQ